MEKQTNYLDFLAESQKKMVESWNEASQKLMDSTFGEDTLPKKSIEMFTNLLKDHKAAVEELTAKGDMKDMLSSSPETFKKMVETQAKFAEELMIVYKAHAENLMALPGTSFEDFNQTIKESYQKWEAWVKENMSKMQDGFSQGQVSFNEMVSTMNFSNAYATMQTNWQQLLEAIKSGVYSQDHFAKLFPKDTYESVVNSMMGFPAMESIKNSSMQFNGMFDSYIAQLKKMQADSAAQIHEAVEKGNSLLRNDWMGLASFSNELFSKMQATYAPFMGFIAQGQEHDMIQSMRKAQEKYAEYVHKSAILQMKVYDGAQKGMIATLDFFWMTYQKEGKLPTYDDFLAQWVSELEKQVSAIFESDEYKSLQQEVSTAEEEVKENMSEILKNTTKGLPFASKAEIESLETEIDELKKQLAANADSAKPKSNGTAKKATAE